MVHCTKKWIRALQKKICINFASLRRKHKDLPHLNLFWQWWLLLIFEISNHFNGVLVNAAAWASLEDFLLTKCMHLEWVSHFCLKCLWILSKKYALFLESKESSLYQGKGLMGRTFEIFTKKNKKKRDTIGLNIRISTNYAE